MVDLVFVDCVLSSQLYNLLYLIEVANKYFTFTSNKRVDPEFMFMIVKSNRLTAMPIYKLSVVWKLVIDPASL